MTSSGKICCILPQSFSSSIRYRSITQIFVLALLSLILTLLKMSLKKVPLSKLNLISEADEHLKELRQL